MLKADRFDVIKRATLLCASMNFLLGVIQLAAGFIFSSWALFADSLHTLTDIGCDLVIYIAACYSAEPPDKEHPYGHYRMETLASMLMGAVLLVIASILIWEVAASLFFDTSITGPIIGKGLVAVACYSVIQNELLYQYCYYRAKQIDSDLLKATALHQRLDAFSSIIVLVGVVFHEFGVEHADMIAALIIALMIFKMSYKIIRDAANELIDLSVSQETYDLILNAVENVSEVRCCNQLRSRQVAGSIRLDLMLTLNRDITLVHACEIKEATRKAINDLKLPVIDIVIDVSCEEIKSDPAS